MSALLDMSAVIAQLDPLRAAGHTKFIGGIGSLPEAADQIKATPSTFVTPFKELYGDNEVSTAALRQTVTHACRVLIVFKNIGARFADLTAAIDASTAAHKDLLRGWTIDRQIYSPAELVMSAPLESDAEAGTLIYAIDFKTRSHERKP